MSEAFHTSPIELLDSSSEEWAILLACATALSRDHEEARKKSKQQRS